MTITREQVADLRPGDVVEVRWDRFPGVFITGPLRLDRGELRLGDFTVRGGDGAPGLGNECALTVVSRAPRPLYVNHPRTEPVPGDVVRDADDEEDTESWNSCGHGSWYDRHGIGVSRLGLPARLRLLVDGETGQVVP